MVSSAPAVGARASPRERTATAAATWGFFIVLTRLLDGGLAATVRAREPVAAVGRRGADLTVERATRVGGRAAVAEEAAIPGARAAVAAAPAARAARSVGAPLGDVACRAGAAVGVS